MEKQVNAITKACYYYIHNIGSIKHYIKRNACKTLGHALIPSRLDYSNTLLCGLPGIPMTCLQRVQNYAQVEVQDPWACL